CNCMNMNLDSQDAAIFARRDLEDAELATWLESGATDVLPYGGDRDRAVATIRVIAGYDAGLEGRTLPPLTEADRFEGESDHMLRGRLLASLHPAMRDTPLKRAEADRVIATAATPPDAAPIAPTEQDRADARELHPRDDRESAEQHSQRIEWEARA